jgi:hypothetical protein
MVITDGMKVTLGDTAALTFYVTPGHTAGTMSTLIPVKDRGTPHLVAEWAERSTTSPQPWTLSSATVRRAIPRRRQAGKCGRGHFEPPGL